MRYSKYTRNGSGPDQDSNGATTMRTYEIRVRNEFGGWTFAAAETARYIGGTEAENTFSTEAEAENAIRQLRNTDNGENGWGDLDAEVVDVLVTRHTVVRDHTGYRIADALIGDLSEEIFETEEAAQAEADEWNDQDLYMESMHAGPYAA